VDILYLYMLFVVYVLYATRDNPLAFVLLLLLFFIGYYYTLFGYKEMNVSERFWYVNGTSIVLTSSLYRAMEAMEAIWLLIIQKRKTKRLQRLRKNNLDYIPLSSVLQQSTAINPRSRRSPKIFTTEAKTRSSVTSRPSRKRVGRSTRAAI